MLTIRLTQAEGARKELLLERTVRVVSRSGLNITERTLIEQLKGLPAGTIFHAPLFLGGRTGALAMTLWMRGEVTGEAQLVTWDAHTVKTLERNLEQNHAPTAGALTFSVTSELDLAQFPEADAIFWQMTRGDGTAEEHLAALEGLSVEGCAKGRQFFIAADEVNPTFLERFKKVCAKVSYKKVGDKRHGEVYVLSGTLAHPIATEKRPNHMATFEASLKGHEPLTLHSLPGCFCHRRADMGGLALTEVVAEHVDFEANDRIMDMGCGCGMDGLLLANAFEEKHLHITYQDSSAAAIESVRLNLTRYPHQAEVIYAADGQGEAECYDLFLANPPYFGDWRIAEFFIATAKRVLKRDGLLAFVAKSIAKPTELIEAGGFEILNAFARRGYTVLLARKR